MCFQVAAPTAAALEAPNPLGISVSTCFRGEANEIRGTAARGADVDVPGKLGRGRP
jgi:hypothetical protein